MHELNRFGLTSVIDAGEDSNSIPRTTPSLRPCKSQGLLTLRFARDIDPVAILAYTRAGALSLH
jgi:hypothetical protein